MRAKVKDYREKAATTSGKAAGGSEPEILVFDRRCLCVLLEPLDNGLSLCT